MENYANGLNTLKMFENSKPSNNFSTKKIMQYTEDKSVNLIAVDRLSSTNTVLKSLSNFLPDKTVLIADSQTAGRGRLNKSFFSPDGSGIYMSVLIRKRFSYKDALMITPLVAVAVLDVIKDYSSNAKIKWVNDIYIDDKKVCGILTESSFNNETHLTDYVVIGIGLNVKRPNNDFPSNISNIATSLLDDKSNTDVDLLAAKIINSLLTKLYEHNLEEIANVYSKKSYLDGKMVSVITATETYRAKVLGVDENLRLIVKNNDGEIITLSSGEVSTMPII